MLTTPILAALFVTAGAVLNYFGASFIAGILFAERLAGVYAAVPSLLGRTVIAVTCFNAVGNLLLAYAIRLDASVAAPVGAVAVAACWVVIALVAKNVSLNLEIMAAATGLIIFSGWLSWALQKAAVIPA